MLRASLAFSTVFLLALTTAPSMAQEACYKDASKKFSDWRGSAGKTLNDLSKQCEDLGKECYKQKITYNGMEMPIAAALIIEGEKYGKNADIKVNQVVGEAQDCAGQTRTVRGVYDFAREILGITTVLPERATRIDFEEIRRGNIAGGDKSFVRDTGRFIDETFNPFRW